MHSLKKTRFLILIQALWQIIFSGATDHAEVARMREIEAFKDDINVVDRPKDDLTITHDTVENEDSIVTMGQCDSMRKYLEASRYFPMREPVPPERTREIRKNLGRHQAHISAMITAYKGLTTTLNEFEEKLSFRMEDKYFLKSLKENHKLMGRLADSWVIQWGARDSQETASESPGEPLQNPSRYWVPPPKTSFRSTSKNDLNSNIKSSAPARFKDATKSIMETIDNISIYRCWERVLDKPEEILFKAPSSHTFEEDTRLSAGSVGIQNFPGTVPPSIQKSFSKNQVPIANKASQESEENEERIPRDVLMIIIDKLIYNRIQILNELFNHSQELLLSSNASAKDRYQVQLCGQKYILQAIQYMFQFQMITNEHLERFFSTPGAVELTGKHLFQLFYMYSYGFSKDETFVPEMNFISNHRFTSHLHGVIKALDKKTQGKILKNALWYTVDRFERAFKRLRTPYSREINFLFFHGGFQDQLESWPKIPTGSDKNTMNYCDYLLQKLVNYYQKPPTVSYVSEELKKAEYLIVHYFLIYIKNYHENVNLREVLQGDENINYDIFEKQFKLIEEGLAYHQRKSLISSFSSFSKANYIDIYLQKTMRKHDASIKKLNELSQSFRERLMELNELSDLHRDLNTWLYGIQLNNGNRATNVSSELVNILKCEMENPLSSTINEGRNLWMAKSKTMLWYEYYDPRQMTPFA